MFLSIDALKARSGRTEPPRMRPRRAAVPGRAVPGRLHRTPPAPGPATVRGAARAWAAAAVAPRLAMLAGAGLAVSVVALVGATLSASEPVPMWVALLLVFSPPVLLLSLPRANGAWRFAALPVAFLVTPVLYAAPASPSVPAYLDSLVATVDGGTGWFWVVAAAALPPLEAAGAWLRRAELADEAARRSRQRRERLPLS